MYQLRVQFTGYWKPPLWRRLEMPSKAKLQDLHYAIVAVLGGLMKLQACSGITCVSESQPRLTLLVI